ncbi:MAG: uracil-DNA glycosylase [Verrucomicrobiota bacterium]
MSSNFKQVTLEYIKQLQVLGLKEVEVESDLINRLVDFGKSGHVSHQTTSALSTFSKSGAYETDRICLSQRVEEQKNSLASSEMVGIERSIDETSNKVEELAALQQTASVCQKCQHLASSRTQVVFGVGNPHADIMFVGEAPGADEDLKGEPFVGAAGQLLTKMIAAMGLTREKVYIANVLKCRPDMPQGAPGNRKPTLSEMTTCRPYLAAQISIIEPKVLVALGSTAIEGLMGEKMSITRTRGMWHDFQGIPLMPTYHPAFLLYQRDLALKRQVWEDLLEVMERVDMAISEKQRGFFLKQLRS